MKFLTLALVRQQLHADSDTLGEEGDLIEVMACSAEDLALKFIDKTVEELIDEYGEVPSAIKMACLGEIASNYAVRENEAERSARTLRITNYKRWQGALLPYRRVV